MSNNRLFIMVTQLGILAIALWEAYQGAEWTYTSKGLAYTLGGLALLHALETIRSDFDHFFTKTLISFGIPAAFIFIGGGKISYPQALVIGLLAVTFGETIARLFIVNLPSFPIWVQRPYFEYIQKRNALKSAKEHLPEEEIPEFIAFIESKHLENAFQSEGVAGSHHAIAKYIQGKVAKKMQGNIGNMLSKVMGGLDPSNPNSGPTPTEDGTRFEIDLEDFKRRAGL